MKIGVTGTRSGMTAAQRMAVTYYLKGIVDLFNEEQHELHHGDCVGVDVEVAEIAKSLGFKVINHPPVKEDLRAFHESHEHREPLSYFARNRKIVEETKTLFVIPYQNEWQDNGGTWYTHDYAAKKQKSRITFFPNGEVQTVI